MRKNMVISIVILSLLLLIGCRKEKASTHEFTTEDVFLIQNITSDKITVYGIGLGASVSDVVKVFDKPDNKKEYILEGETNIEYGESINLSGNGLIFHFDNGTLTRMTIKPPFTEHYQTRTQLNLTKEEVYGQFGLPDSQKNVLDYRVFTYDKMGMDLFLKGKNVNRVSFFRKT